MSASPSIPVAPIEWQAIDLGPDLTMPVFTSVERWHQDRVGALALYCSDGRWGEAFDDFCHKHLLIPRYDRWAVPGGPGCLVRPDNEPGYCETARGQLDFLVRAHKLERIVLITHYGCAYYAHRLERSANECLADQTRDVRSAASLFRSWYPDIRVEAYLAMRKEHCLSFHRLDT
jgi:hypothetical protein